MYEIEYLYSHLTNNDDRRNKWGIEGRGQGEKIGIEVKREGSNGSEKSKETLNDVEESNSVGGGT